MPYGGGGGGGGAVGFTDFALGGLGGGAKKQGNDSHRLALLLTQLYTDRRTKSVWASVVNVLGRNRALCVRMPRFRDTRKMRQGQVFNAWKDAAEPRTPLGDLLASVVPTMQRLKRRRGAILFPPKPPHDALPPPPKTCGAAGRLPRGARGRRRRRRARRKPGTRRASCARS